MSKRKVTQRPLRAKLIFNAISGRPQESPQQLADILTEMQSQNIQPEVFMVSPDSDAEGAVRRAIREGIRLIVVAGGDGTIDSVMGALVGSPATLGIIPTGTRNNVSFNLGVPGTVPEAVALLREGRRLKIDVGHLRSGHASRWFLEAASLGLLSDLYPAADDIQHGDLGQIGTLVSTFVASTPSRLRAVLNGRHRFGTNAYMVLIANMPYLGPRMQIARDVSCRDNRLDVFVFSEMSKLDLISMAMQSAGGPVEDAHVKHYRVRQLNVKSDPLMPVLADGIILQQGAVTVDVHPRALAVIAGESGPAIDNQKAQSEAATPIRTGSMRSEIKEDPLPPETEVNRLWTARRRSAVLAGLAVGVVGFLIWLPAAARSALFAALLAHRTLMSMLILFTLIALSLLWSVGQRLDMGVFLLFNLRGTRPKWLDSVMWLATQVGNMGTAILSATFFFLTNSGRLAAEIIFGTLTLWLLVETIKALTDRARPFLALQTARVIGWRERGRSFPSGHTSQTFFMVTLLSHRFDIGLAATLALYAVAVLVGFTRVYLGAHYPRDVIAGAVLGSVWGVLAALVDPYWHGLRF